MLSDPELRMYIKSRQMLLQVSYYVALMGGFGGAVVMAWGIAAFTETRPFDGVVGLLGGGLLIVLCLLVHLLARCLAAILSICIELLEIVDTRRREGV